METKKGYFVSTMKNLIIDESIKSLQTEGLRFSVDTLASRLKISKKTIYKYFPNKEALALAMYEKYYKAANEKMAALLRGNENAAFSGVLRMYYDSKKMIRSEIFNKYKLNDVIRSYAEEQNECLWSAIATAFLDSLSDSEIEAAHVIVDGAFEKLCENQESPDAVIERLVKMIC